MSLLKKLEDLGLHLPPVPAQTVSNYIPVKKIGNLLFVAGQTCRRNGKMEFCGPVQDLAIAQQASQLCALNMLAVLQQFIGLDNMKGCVRLGVFVCCTDNFTQQAQVAHAASQLMLDLWSESGQHVRTAVGVAALPGASMVEIEGIFEL